MADRQIRYGIGFDVDSSGLQQIRNELNSFQQSLNLKDLKLINKDATEKDLNELLSTIKKDAQIMGDALEKSFNPKLGTVNIDTFNNSLKASGRSVKDLEASLAKAGPTGKAAFRNMTAELFTTQKAVKQTSSFIDSMAKTLFNTIKWSIASSAINTVTSAVRNAWNYTVQLDSSLNDIRIVTEKSSEEMEKFAGKANKAAKSLGAATTAYTKASLIYYQQGLAEEDVQARTDVTIKAANVTGQSASEVSEQLTAVWNGYRVVAEDAEKYVDKLSAVAASTASDLEELSEGMSKVASGANAMGVDIDQLTAQLSTIISVTRQDASSVGTALKTIFARLGDLKVDGVDEFGVSLGDVSGTLQKVGIEVLDQQGNLRDMGTVMEEVAGKWGTWTEAQQQAIAVAMAGKRQYNNLLALFENWDMYESALTTSQTSEGTLQKQQDIYMDSLDAKLQQLSTSGEKIYKSLFDSDSMKDFIDVLTVALDGLGQFIDGIGGGGNILLMLVSTLGNKWSNEIAMGIGRAAFNMEVMKENALQVKAETLLMAEYEDINEAAMEKMVALKKEQLRANEYLTEEEKEQYNYLIKQTAELYNQKDALEQKGKDANEFYRENVKEGSSVTDAEGNLFLDNEGKPIAEKDLTEAQRAQVLKGRVKDLENISVDNFRSEIIDKQKDIQTSRIIQEQALPGLDASTLYERDAAEKEFERGAKIEENAKKRLLDIDIELEQQAKKLLDSNKLTKEQQEQLTKTLKEFGEAKETGINLDEKRLELNNQNNSSLNNSKQAYNDNVKVLETNTDAQKRNNEAIAEGEKLSNSLSKGVQFKAIAKGATQIVSSVGMAASSIMSLTSAFKALGDESLSSSEKILQFISGVTMAGGMLAGSLKNIGKGIKEVALSLGLQNTELGKSFIEWKTNIAIQKAAKDVVKKSNAENLKATYIQRLRGAGINKTEKELMELNNEELRGLLITKGLDDEELKSAYIKLLLAANIDKTENELRQLNTEKLKQLAIDKGLMNSNGQLTLSNNNVSKSFGSVAKNLGSLLIKALPYIIGIAIIVVAIISAVAGIKEALDDGKKALEKASKAAQEAAERFNEIKQAYEDLKKSFEDYNKAQKAIDEMTKGTEEWKNAIQEANMQVIDLIDKYPELAQYVSDVNGQLKISEEGQEAVLQAQEEEVKLANRGKMVANIERNKAENNMIAQQGSQEVFNTNTRKTVGYSVGSGLMAAGAIMGMIPAIGWLAGGITAAVGALINGFNALDNHEDEAYTKALEVIEENGNAIFKDRETFESEMRLAGINERLIDALWENKEELAKNSAEISANNAAIKLQQQQVTASYLDSNSETYKASKNQDAISKIIANNSNTDSEAYKEELKKIAGSNEKVKSKDEAKNVFEQSGINGTFKEFKDGIITYVDEKGNEKQIDADTMAKQVAQEKALAAAGGEENVKKIEAALNTVAKNFGDKFGKAASKAVTGFVAGEKADLSTLTEAEIKDLDFAVNEIKADGSNKKTVAKALGFNDFKELEEHAKSLGYDSGEAYVKAIQTSVDNYKYEAKNVLTGLNNSVKEAYNKLDTKNWTLATQKAVAGSLESAFKENGTVAVDALQGLFADAADDLDEEDMQALANIAGKIDWSSSNALLEFNNQLEDLGINIPEDELGKFAQQMSGLVNVVNEVMTNLNGLRASFKELGDLTKDLKLGDTLSDEDYNNLIKYNKELANYFVMTADGYQYIGGGEEAFKKTKAKQFDYNKAKEQFGKAEDQGKDLLTNGLFDTTAVTDEQKAQSIAKLAGNSAYADILEASGYTQDQILDAIGKSSEKSTFAKGYTLNQLKGMKAEDLAKATGMSQEAAQRAIDDAIGQLKTSEEMIKGAYNAVNDNLTKIEEGTFSQNLEDTATSYVTSMANSYDELQEYKDMLSKDSYQKLAKVYLAKEAEQLGINAEEWEKISKAMPIEKQDEYINNLQKIKNYDEVDYYKKVNYELKKVKKDLDNLSNTQEKLYGKDVLVNMDKQIEKQQKLVELENQKLKQQKEEWALRRQNMSDTYNSRLLNDFGISGITYDENGMVDENTRNRILAALDREDISESDKEYLRTVLNSIDTFNTKIEEGIEEHSQNIIKAYQEAADLLIEKFNLSIQVKLDLEQAKMDWEEFSNSMYKKGEGLKFFDEESATDTINNAVSRSESITSSLVTVMGAINNSNDALDTANDTIAEFEEDYDLSQYETDYSNAKKTQGETNTVLESETRKRDAAQEKESTAETEYEDAKKAEGVAETNHNNAVKAYNDNVEYLEANKDRRDEYNYFSKRELRDVNGQKLNLTQAEYDGLMRDTSGNAIYKATNAHQRMNDETLSETERYNAEQEYNSLLGTASRYNNGTYNYDPEFISEYGAALDENAVLQDNKNKTYYDYWVTAKGNTQSKKDAYDNAVAERKLITNDQGTGSYDVALADKNAADTAVSDAEKELNDKKAARTKRADEILESNLRYVTKDDDGNPIVNEAAYKEDMDKWMGEAQDYYEELKAEAETVYEAYFTAQEEIMGMFDKEIEKLSSMNSILSSQAELMKLVGKNAKGSGELVAKLYTSIRENSKNNFVLSEKQLKAAEEEYTKVIKMGNAASKEQIATVTENLQTATENMLSMASEYSTAIAEEYGAALTGIIDDYFKEIAGMDLESLTQDWELATKEDERYLDEVNSSYAIDDLNRKIQKSIDETDSYTAQKKLNELKQKEVDILEKKGKLSQYDIDRANAMYELTLKQIALEEAQNTANKMKLTRDASGNYSYQYVADQNEIAKAEEELAKAQNDLYNMDKERQKTLVDDYYSIMQEAQDKMSEAAAAGDTERLKKLQEYYFGDSGLLKGIQSEMSVATENITDIGQALKGTDWTSPFENFAKTVTENTKFQDVLDKINNLTNGDAASGTTGVIGQLKDAATILNTLFTTPDSPLVKATADLNKSISEGIGNIDSELRKSMEASTLAINSLTGEDGLLANMEVVGKELKDLGDKYQQFLKDQIGDNGYVVELGKNTTATQALTNAMYSWLDSQEENEANRNDGKYRDYEKQDNGDWILVQNSGTGGQ